MTKPKNHKPESKKSQYFFNISSIFLQYFFNISSIFLQYFFDSPIGTLSAFSLPQQCSAVVVSRSNEAMDDLIIYFFAVSQFFPRRCIGSWCCNVDGDVHDVDTPPPPPLPSASLAFLAGCSFERIRKRE